MLSYACAKPTLTRTSAPVNWPKKKLTVSWPSSPIRVNTKYPTGFWIDKKTSRTANIRRSLRTRSTTSSVKIWNASKRSALTVVWDTTGGEFRLLYYFTFRLLFNSKNNFFFFVLNYFYRLRVRGQHTKTTVRRGRTVGVSKKKGK